MHWRPNLFMYAGEEISLEDRCKLYWEWYLISLAESSDGLLLFEQSNYSAIRQDWLENKGTIRGLHRSKRFVQRTSILEKCISWCASIPQNESTINYEPEEVETLQELPETFWEHTLFLHFLSTWHFSSLFLHCLLFSLLCVKTITEQSVLCDCTYSLLYALSLSTVLNVMVFLLYSILLRALSHVVVSFAFSCTL